MSDELSPTSVVEVIKTVPSVYLLVSTLMAKLFDVWCTTVSGAQELHNLHKGFSVVFFSYGTTVYCSLEKEHISQIYSYEKKQPKRYFDIVSTELFTSHHVICGILPWEQTWT